ncbi:hypothetical protein JUN65_15230 [Gluconacetobacter azotocaptans]|nr:hypothetical protein [Gluconacetobacter azotocaptans]MBM9402929.1 hypothetical protein [Gluconacetobacter azotocaptans]
MAASRAKRARRRADVPARLLITVLREHVEKDNMRSIVDIAMMARF